ncbi:hypothetical protein IFM89_011418 [Coptis chinensis]|uniref:Amino acid transporter transmembrane domain-containing protein n=1 Tax=Coptis chinensis TaxID=261450 RepID=A0A835LV87_9MAGN|nr:hypothetical protein IFM89_011418 [Coptis chinensis]
MAKWISHGDIPGSLMGIMSREDATLSSASKTWSTFQALGNIAFTFTYAEVLIEIKLSTYMLFSKDTLRSPPSENVTMKKASLYGIGITTIFYIAIGCTRYAAFGDSVPGNILAEFYEPFWLVDVANILIVVHLVGAYQVFAHPIFATIENKIISTWPDTTFFQSVCTIRVPFTKARFLIFMPAKTISRSIFIIFTTIVSMLLPFFNAIMRLLGATSFWPLTVYLPVNMYLSQRKIEPGTPKWFLLHGLCPDLFGGRFFCNGPFIDGLRQAKPFHIES